MCRSLLQIPSTHTRGDCYLPKVRHGSDSNRVTALHQNTLSVDYGEHPKQADLMDGTAGAVGSNKPTQKAPVGPGEPALDWMASLLMTLIAIVSSIQPPF